VRGFGIISGARDDLKIGTMRLHLQLAKAAVKVGVAAVIGQRVAGTDLLIYAVQTFRQVIDAFDELSASVAGNSIQNVVFTVLSFVAHVIEDVLSADCPYPVFLVGQPGNVGKRGVRDRRGGERRAGPESGRVYDIDSYVCSIGQIDHAL